MMFASSTIVFRAVRRNGTPNTFYQNLPNGNELASNVDFVFTQTVFLVLHLPLMDGVGPYI